MSAPTRRSPGLAARLQLPLLLGVIAASGAGCGGTDTPTRLHAAPCGDGELVLQLRVVTQPPAPAQATATLWLERAGQCRQVAELSPRVVPWRRPTAAESFERLRDGDDSWPVFLSPQHVSAPEFAAIRDCLRQHGAAFAAAAASQRTGVRLDYGNELAFTSIRHLDLASLQRRWTGTRSAYWLECDADGEVFLRHPRGATLLGLLVDDGQRLVFAAATRPPAMYGNLLDPLGYAATCIDATTGRAVVDDHAIAVVDDAKFAALRDAELQRRRR